MFLTHYLPDIRVDALALGLIGLWFMYLGAVLYRQYPADLGLDVDDGAGGVPAPRRQLHEAGLAALAGVRRATKSM